MIIWDRGAHGVTSIMFNANYRVRPPSLQPWRKVGTESDPTWPYQPLPKDPATAMGSYTPSVETGLSLSASPGQALPPQRARLLVQASPEACLPSSISSCPVGCPSVPHCSLDPLLWQKVNCPREAWPLQALGGNGGEHPPLSFSVLRSPQLSLK